MSDYTDFLTEVKDWINRPDLSDSVVASWVRSAEARMDRELRVRENHKRSRATVASSYIPLPSDWMEFEYIRYVPDEDSTELNIQRGKPLVYVSHHQMLDVLHDENHTLREKAMYTVVGDELIIAPEISSDTPIEMGYYHRVPQFSADATTLRSRYPDLYLYATLANTPGYLVEDERLAFWASQATSIIQGLNEAWTKGKMGGSPLQMNRRTFG